MFGDSVTSPKRGLLSSRSRVLRSDFISERLRKFHAKYIHAVAKRISSLRYAVSSVLGFTAGLQMGRINTSSIVSGWALVKNHVAFWNRTTTKNPTCDVRGDYSCGTIPKIPSVDLAVSMVYRGHPQPTVVWSENIYLWPKAAWKRFRKSLREEIFRRKVWPRNQVHFGYVTFRAVTGRAGTPFTLSVCPS